MITIDDKKITDFTLDNKNVVKIQDETTLKVLWEKVEPVDVDYFYIENTYNGNNRVVIKKSSSSPVDNHITTLQYSRDKKNWSKTTLSSSTKSFTLLPGEKFFIRNDNGYFNCYGFNIRIHCDNDFIVGGNINTLLNYKDLENVTLTEHCFEQLFYDATKLTSASNLVLPSTTLANNCYCDLFLNCSSLTAAPALPATNLANYCYWSTFQGCTSLTSAPILPATNLKNGSYYYMFCNCSSLKSVTSYANRIDASYCLQNWMDGVASTGTFYNYGSATYPRNINGIPSGWTIVKN